ncbi:C-4 sterol methyl oxidase [Allomyces javanicus]|nr:C-4 sterol methyl oxidase [Allomyces javanicus]
MGVAPVLRRVLVNVNRAASIFASAWDPSEWLQGPDANGLTWLDRTWSGMFEGRNQLVTLTVISFVVHEAVYFGRMIPFMIADHIPALQKYKIQEDKHISNEQWWKCLRGVLCGHYLIELPMMLGFHPAAQMLGMKVSETPLPSWPAILAQTFLFMVIEDAYHYWAHRIIHEYPKAYKFIHKQHHEFAAPVGLAAEYASPYEIVILAIGTFLGPMLYAAAGFEFHVFTMLFWSIVRTMQAIDAHSGYDFPWSLHNWIPFWSGADHHDFHHQNFIGNYATSFRFWDWAMDTEGSYRLVRARQALARAEKEAALKKADSKSALNSKKKN